MRDTQKQRSKPRGRHPHKRLTSVKVRNTKKPGRHADGNGLYLVVDPSGAKRWVLRIVAGGRRRDLGLGGVGTVGLAEARDEALRLRSLARRGVDLVAERQRTRRAVPTFAEAARQVHTQHGASFSNAKHNADWISSLEAYAFPVFGNRRLDSIGSADVLRALTPIWTAKSETARRVKQRIRVVLDWAKASGFRSGDNPTDGLTKVLPKRREAPKHHPALAYQAVPEFLTTVRNANARESSRLGFEFLVLTAMRTGEVLNATWDEIDLDARTWTIPASRMQKARREHRVPLASRAVEILKQARELSDGGPYVFSGRPKAALSDSAFLMLLRRLGRDDITVHGFRSSFRVWAAERTNTPRAVCEAALAHSLRDQTEAAYNRTDLFERRRKLMEAWSAYATGETADVVAIHA